MSRRAMRTANSLPTSCGAWTLPTIRIAGFSAVLPVPIVIARILRPPSVVPSDAISAMPGFASAFDLPRKFGVVGIPFDRSGRTSRDRREARQAIQSIRQRPASSARNSSRCASWGVGLGTAIRFNSDSALRHEKCKSLPLKAADLRHQARSVSEAGWFRFLANASGQVSKCAGSRAYRWASAKARCRAARAGLPWRPSTTTFTRTSLVLIISTLIPASASD